MFVVFSWDWFITLPACPPALVLPLSPTDHSLQIERAYWSMVLPECVCLCVCVCVCVRVREREALDQWEL